MECRLRDLRYKEVINIADGCRYGCVEDAVVDARTGRVTALVVPGRLRLLGLFGREQDLVFPWSQVRQFGEDVVLVEGTGREEKREK